MDGHVLHGPRHSHHLIAEAVYARCISALKDERVAAAKKLKGPRRKISTDRAKFVEDIRRALYASKIVSYAQGYMLMRAAAEGIQLEPELRRHRPHVARRLHHPQPFPRQDQGAFDTNPKFTNLLLDKFFRAAIKECQRSWRNVVAVSAKKGIPTPAFSTALSFYDSYRSERLPANLLQAQRDYFGAHTYERLDKPRGEFFHTNWTGHGGDVSSTTYNA
jgi:6-phosphogluconate dehydrogenase